MADVKALGDQLVELNAGEDVEVDAQRVVLGEGGAEDGGLDEDLLRAAVELLDELADLLEVLGEVGDDDHVLDGVRVAAGLGGTGRDARQCRGGR